MGNNRGASLDAMLIPAMALLPRPMTELGMRLLARRLNDLHCGLGERLAEAEGKSFLFNLSDLPFNVVLKISHGRFDLALLNKHTLLGTDVVIHGAGGILIALLEGRVDGDALFFSRGLRVEGDTEALLVLRNTLDNEQISLRDIIFSFLGPLAGFASRAAVPAEKLAVRFLRDMRRLRGI